MNNSPFSSLTTFNHLNTRLHHIFIKVKRHFWRINVTIWCLKCLRLVLWNWPQNWVCSNFKAFPFCRLVWNWDDGVQVHPSQAGMGMPIQTKLQGDVMINYVNNKLKWSWSTMSTTNWNEKFSFSPLPFLVIFFVIVKCCFLCSTSILGHSL